MIWDYKQTVDHVELIHDTELLISALCGVENKIPPFFNVQLIKCMAYFLHIVGNRTSTKQNSKHVYKSIILVVIQVNLFWIGNGYEFHFGSGSYQLISLVVLLVIFFVKTTQ